MITVEEVKAKTPERFWKKIAFGEPNECWKWIAAKWAKANGVGYGSFATQHNLKKRSMSAHRFMYEFIYGKFDLNLDCLHKCDNSICVNPNHLFLGTHQDNMDDKKMKKRGNQPFGTKHPLAKLTEEKVKIILLKLRYGNELQKDIAFRFGVDPAIIKRIKYGTAWGHVKID